MEWKYKKVFLLILLCLVSCEFSFAQSYISMKYDENGNRERMTISRIAVEKEIVNKDMIRNEISENKFDDVVSIYPNPNNGILNIRIDVGKHEVLSQYEIYNVEGLLVGEGDFYGVTTIDIEGQPSGVYLLKVICKEEVCSKVVVKL